MPQKTEFTRDWKSEFDFHALIWHSAILSQLLCFGVYRLVEKIADDRKLAAIKAVKV